MPKPTKRPNHSVSKCGRVRVTHRGRSDAKAKKHLVGPPGCGAWPAAKREELAAAEIRTLTELHGVWMKGRVEQIWKERLGDYLEAGIAARWQLATRSQSNKENFQKCYDDLYSILTRDDCPLHWGMRPESITEDVLVSYIVWRGKPGTDNAGRPRRAVGWTTIEHDFKRINQLLNLACGNTAEAYSSMASHWSRARSHAKVGPEPGSRKVASRVKARLEAREVRALAKVVDFHRPPQILRVPTSHADTMAALCATAMDIGELVKVLPGRHLCKLVKGQSRTGDGSEATFAYGWEDRREWDRPGFFAFDLRLRDSSGELIDPAGWATDPSNIASGKRGDRGPRLVPICDQSVGERLARAAVKADPAKPLFERRKDALPEALALAIKELGLHRENSTLQIKWTAKRPTLHLKALRRTFQIWAEKAGVPASFIKLQMGHAPDKGSAGDYKSFAEPEAYILAEAVNGYLAEDERQAHLRLASVKLSATTRTPT